jgi:ABC-type multidrug transport system fused ATPase/permease subunit
MGERSPADESMSERVGESTVKMWLLMQANRWLLTAVVLLGSFCLFVALSQLQFGSMREIARTQNGLRYLFSPLIGAIITGTAIVVTINQLVLAQELGAVGDQRNRMESAMTFREDVENSVDTATSSPAPSLFFADLLGGIEAQADRLQEVTADESDGELEQQVTEYVESLTENTRPVEAALRQSQFGTFDVVWNALSFNYSLKIHRARQLRDEHASVMSDATVEAFDDVIEALALFAPAREHFKTLYFQWELINLSRALLYTSVPALVVMGTIITTVDATSVPGQTLGVDNLVLLTSFGFTVGIAPFVVFIVYILRIVTVAKRTLAIGPFVLRETRRQGESD